MVRKQTKGKKSSIFPLFVFSIVALGLFVAVSQVNQQQNVATRAQTVPTPDQSKFDAKAPPTNCPNSPADLQTSQNEQAMFNAINAYRQQNNRKAIMYTPELKKSAKWYSKDLSQKNVQMPNGIDSFNRPLENRLFDCVVDISGEFTEQIGIGPDVQSVLVALQADPVVNGNLLSSTADYMAVGQTGNYWVVDMVAPPGSAPNQPVTNPQAQQQQQQQQNNGGSNIPSPACLGSCPTGEPDAGGASGGNANQNQDGQDQAPAPCPSGEVTTNSLQGNDVEANHKKKGGYKKKGHGGKNNDALLQQLIKILEELIKLLGGNPTTSAPSDGTGDAGNTNGGSGGTNPC